MKIYNAIWLNNDLEPTAESFSTFEKALASVKSDLRNYTKRYNLSLVDKEHEGYYFARIEDVVEVEIIGTEVQ